MTDRPLRLKTQPSPLTQYTGVVLGAPAIAVATTHEGALATAWAAASTLALTNARLEEEILVLRAERQASRQAQGIAESAHHRAEDSRNVAIAAEERALFLAETGRVLAQSLDYHVTLTALARLAVPLLADYCAVEITDATGVLRPLAVTHLHKEGAAAVLDLHTRFQDDPAAAYGAPGVLRTGRAELVSDVEATVATSEHDPVHLSLVREIGLVSSMIVPLFANDQVIGAVTLGTATTERGGTGRRFIAADLLYAEDVGRRAGVAIENARLHEVLRETNATLEAQNTELEMQQIELESQQAQVQEQAMELEMQSDDLSARNDALTSANVAFERATAAAEAATTLAEHAFRAANVAQRTAQDANASKSQFLANMSHELRTPLNAIAGYAELLTMGIEGPVTPGQQNYLTRLSRAQRHLLTLINDVLSFAQLEVGQSQFQVVDVPVGELCASLEELVRPQLDLKRLVYRSTPNDVRTPAEPLVLRADRDRTLQILLNLVGNAVKFTAQDGVVELSVVVSDDDVLIRIADTGRGIPADKLAAVFEPFVQIRRGDSGALFAPSAPRDGGVGLGLAISRDLARRMDGDIGVESEIGVGSTFSLRLPRAGAHAA